MKYEKEIITNKNQIKEYLSNFGSLRGEIIAIDGIQGSGKGCLAKFLSEELDGLHLNLDSFVEKGKGGFFDFFSFEHFKKRLDSALKSQKSIFIEGVQVLKILQKGNIIPKLLIYVIPPDEELSETINNLETFSALPKSSLLVREVAGYHKQYEPYKKADIFFKRKIDK